MRRHFIALIFLFANTNIWMATEAHAGGDVNGFWIDTNLIIGKIASSSVEFGFDGVRYVTLDGWNRRNAQQAKSDLGYQVTYSGSGSTQWVSFDFVGTNFFGSGLDPAPVFSTSGHMPILLRNGTFQNSTVIYNAEGKGIFLGPNAVASSYGSSCGAPDTKDRIFFETRVVNANSSNFNEVVAGVKCADWYSDKYFVDGQQYHIDMHVSDTYITYWIYLKYPNGTTTLWSSNGTNALDYYCFANSQACQSASAYNWLTTQHSRMNTSNIGTLAIILAGMPSMDPGYWSLKITNLNSNRF